MASNSGFDFEFDFQAMFYDLPECIYIIRKDGTLVDCNYAQAVIFGFKDRSGIIGKTIFDFQEPEVAAAIRANDLEVMESGIEVRTEETAKLLNGETAIFLSRKIPLRNKKGEVVGLMGISINITQEKKSEEQRLENLKAQEARRTAEMIAERLKIMTNTMAHELRTPLQAVYAGISGIKNYVPNLLKTYEIAKGAGLEIPPINTFVFKSIMRCLGAIESSTHYAFAFIDMILMNIKSEIGIDRNAFSVHPILEAVRESIKKYPFEGHEQDLIEVDETNAFEYLGNHRLTVHMLFNLIKNSLYFIKGAGKGTITIRFSQDKDFNYLHFLDTAQGVNPVDMEMMFRPFKTSRHDGTGLGLAFCKVVMEAGNGDIICRSVFGEYAEFVLSFPRRIEQPS